MKTHLRKKTTTPAAFLIGGIPIMALGMLLSACGTPEPLGMFEGQTNVGDPEHAGVVQYEAGQDVYRITGGGENMWDSTDAFYYAWRQVDADGVLYTSRGYASGPYLAIRVGGRGDVSASHILWRSPTRAPYISSLLLYDGLLYMATELGIVSATDATDGALVWRARLDGVFTASPVAADGHVYLLGESGETFVLAAGREPTVVARNPLGERTLASPAISNGRIFIRTDDHLIAIGSR